VRFCIAGLSVCLAAGSAAAQAPDRDAAFAARLRISEAMTAKQDALLARERKALIQLGLQAHAWGAHAADLHARRLRAIRGEPDAVTILDAVAKARGRRPVGRDNLPAWEEAWTRFTHTWAAEWMELSRAAGMSLAPDYQYRFARRALARRAKEPAATALLDDAGAAALAPGPPAPVTTGDWDKAWHATWGPFAVKSDATVPQARRAVSWLEHSLAWSREHCSATFSCRFAKPIKVFVFGSRASFTAEMERFHRNRAKNAADLWGFYSGRDQAIHALLPEGDDVGLGLVMQHEGVHAFLALGEPRGRHVIRKPGALAMEAVAVWSEQFTLQQHRWVSDRDRAGRLTALRERLAAGDRLQLRGLFEVSEFQMRKWTAVELYAWAAAVAWFFCEHPDPKRALRMREAFLEYLRRWYTVDVEPDVLTELTKRDWPALEKAWHAHLTTLAKPK
jgi:hypothetical protein